MRRLDQIAIADPDFMTGDQIGDDSGEGAEGPGCSGRPEAGDDFGQALPLIRPPGPIWSRDSSSL